MTPKSPYDIIDFGKVIIFMLGMLFMYNLFYLLIYLFFSSVSRMSHWLHENKKALEYGHIWLQEREKNSFVIR